MYIKLTLLFFAFILVSCKTTDQKTNGVINSKTTPEPNLPDFSDLTTAMLYAKANDLYDNRMVLQSRKAYRDYVKRPDADSLIVEAIREVLDNDMVFATSIFKSLDRSQADSTKTAMRSAFNAVFEFQIDKKDKKPLYSQETVLEFLEYIKAPKYADKSYNTSALNPECLKYYVDKDSTFYYSFRKCQQLPSINKLLNRKFQKPDAIIMGLEDEGRVQSVLNFNFDEFGNLAKLSVRTKHPLLAQAFYNAFKEMEKVVPAIRNNKFNGIGNINLPVVLDF